MPANSNPQTRYRTALVAAGLALSAATLTAQGGSVSSLPATAPTQANALPAPIAAKPAPAADALPRRRARVTYTAGLLGVEANNSSLNGILRDIAQLTGMKITGTVGDQRVFGKYGPAEPSTILATLLDGTGSNMLLKETAANAPAELILTPRIGAASAPSPSTSNQDSDEDDASPAASTEPAINNGLPPGQQAPGAAMQTQPTTSGPQPIPQPANNVLGSPSNTTQSVSTLPTVQSVPTDSISTPSTAQPVSGIVDSTNPPPPGSTGFGSATPTQPAADAPKTPEQIYQQLQQLRQAAQQKQQGQSGSGTSTTPTTTSTPQ